MNAEIPFDKTERFPSAWEHGDERYVRDTNEWVARCRARVLQLDVVLKVEEADSMVWDMCQLERWRVMVPEKAADQLYQPIPTRSKSPATSAADKPIGARSPIVGTPEHRNTWSRNVSMMRRWVAPAQPRRSFALRCPQDGAQGTHRLLGYSVLYDL